MMVGLRGVGKTVLLVEIRRRAESADYQSLMVEAREASTPGPDLETRKYA
jgi:predicted AAA+ superfamily ATPase